MTREHVRNKHTLHWLSVSSYIEFKVSISLCYIDEWYVKKKKESYQTDTVGERSSISIARSMFMGSLQWRHIQIDCSSLTCRGCQWNLNVDTFTESLYIALRLSMVIMPDVKIDKLLRSSKFTLKYLRFCFWFLFLLKSSQMCHLLLCAAHGLYVFIINYQL